MEDNSNVAVLADAKKEYTNYIIDVFRPGIFQGIQSLYEDSKDSCDQDNTPKDILKEFQNSLTRIPKWSQDLINKEFERIQNQKTPKLRSQNSKPKKKRKQKNVGRE